MISKLINSINARPVLWIGWAFVVSMAAMALTGFAFPDVVRKCWNEPFLLIFRERKCVNKEVYEFFFLQAMVTAWVAAGVIFGIGKILMSEELRERVFTLLSRLFSVLGGLLGMIQSIIAIVEWLK